MGQYLNPGNESFASAALRINSKDDVLTLLIHLGYLGYDSKTEEAYIPNEEVRKAFAAAQYSIGWHKLSKR